MIKKFIKGKIDVEKLQKLKTKNKKHQNLHLNNNNNDDLYNNHNQNDNNDKDAASADDDADDYEGDVNYDNNDNKHEIKNDYKMNSNSAATDDVIVVDNRNPEVETISPDITDDDDDNVNINNMSSSRSNEDSNYNMKTGGSDVFNTSPKNKADSNNTNNDVDDDEIMIDCSGVNISNVINLEDEKCVNIDNNNNNDDDVNIDSPFNKECIRMIEKSKYIKDSHFGMTSERILK